MHMHNDVIINVWSQEDPAVELAAQETEELKLKMLKEEEQNLTSEELGRK